MFNAWADNIELLPCRPYRKESEIEVGLLYRIF